MGRVVTVEHPLVQHIMTRLRDRTTGTCAFRDWLAQLGTLLACEVTRGLPTGPVEVQTPITRAVCRQLSEPEVAVIPVLRAGLGLAEGILRVLPWAVVGHVGLYRNEETHRPVEYFCKLPDRLSERAVLLIDPMLATGGSAVAAIQLLKEHGARQIELVSAIACPEGLAAVAAAHPDVNIYTAAVDPQLNDQAYIVPGLGDAGDRLYGT